MRQLGALGDNKMTKWFLHGGVAAAALVGATAVSAQTPGGEPVAAPPVSASEILVTADIAFRHRTIDPNPVISYDLEYFQRFEPVSVGEMLKRVPGATFTRSEEHTSELQSLMHISYAVFCLKKKTRQTTTIIQTNSPQPQLKQSQNLNSRL